MGTIHGEPDSPEYVPAIALKQYLSNLGLKGDVDFLREAVHLLSQMLMELEIEQKTGAAKRQRSPGRQNQRNGYRERLWETRVGEIHLRIPKIAPGQLLPEHPGTQKKS